MVLLMEDVLFLSNRADDKGVCEDSSFAVTSALTANGDVTFV